MYSHHQYQDDVATISLKLVWPITKTASSRMLSRYSSIASPARSIRQDLLITSSSPNKVHSSMATEQSNRRCLIVLVSALHSAHSATTLKCMSTRIS